MRKPPEPIALLVAYPEPELAGRHRRCSPASTMSTSSTGHTSQPVQPSKLQSGVVAAASARARSSTRYARATPGLRCSQGRGSSSANDARGERRQLHAVRLGAPAPGLKREPLGPRLEAGAAAPRVLDDVRELPPASSEHALEQRHLRVVPRELDALAGHVLAQNALPALHFGELQLRLPLKRRVGLGDERRDADRHSHASALVRPVCSAARRRASCARDRAMPRRSSSVSVGSPSMK